MYKYILLIAAEAVIAELVAFRYTTRLPQYGRRPKLNLRLNGIKAVRMLPAGGKTGKLSLTNKGIIFKPDTDTQNCIRILPENIYSVKRGRGRLCVCYIGGPDEIFHVRSPGLWSEIINSYYRIPRR